MKRTLPLILALLLAFALTGCQWFSGYGGNAGTDSDKAVTSNSDSVSATPGSATDSATGNQTDTTSGDTDETEDILLTPPAELSEDGRKALAEYLFETYIPCSYGIFSDAKSLSAAAVWSSVEALNRAVDRDESAESRKLENVLKKVEIYYPDTPFDPEKVRVYDKATQTFAASPAMEYEYVLTGYEIKGETVTVYYTDKPDANDPDSLPEEYATTLKHSAKEGYFSFVSSVKTGGAG